MTSSPVANSAYATLRYAAPPFIGQCPYCSNSIALHLAGTFPHTQAAPTEESVGDVAAQEIIEAAFPSRSRFEPDSDASSALAKTGRHAHAIFNTARQLLQENRIDYPAMSRIMAEHDALTREIKLFSECITKVHTRTETETVTKTKTEKDTYTTPFYSNMLFVSETPDTIAKQSRSTLAKHATIIQDQRLLHVQTKTQQPARGKQSADEVVNEATTKTSDYIKTEVHQPFLYHLTNVPPMRLEIDYSQNHQQNRPVMIKSPIFIHPGTFDSVQSLSHTPADVEYLQASLGEERKIIIRRRKRKVSKHEYGVCCRNCGVTETPEWRTGPENKPILCNACGLKFKKYGPEMQRPKSDARPTKEGNTFDGTNASLWLSSSINPESSAVDVDSDVVDDIECGDILDVIADDDDGDGGVEWLQTQAKSVTENCTQDEHPSKEKS